MDYAKLRTRIKDKFTREYRKTKHTEEYTQTEKDYKKTREEIRNLELETQGLIQAFSSASLYDNLTSTLASGFEMVKESIKKQGRGRTEVTREEPDVFGLFAGTAQAIAHNTGGEASRQFEGLSYSLKKVSASRVQFKEGMARVVELIREMKNVSTEIDDSRLKILDIRQMVEAARTQEEEQRLMNSFNEETARVYDEMKKYSASPELSEIALGVTGSLRGFFGDAYDAMAENIAENK